MKFAIPSIGAADLDVAASAQLGVETIVSVSYSDIVLVGELVQGVDLPGSSWTPDGAFAVLAGTAGRDLALICENGCLSGEEIVIEFNVHLEGVGTPAGKALAHFVLPEFANDQTFNLPIGLATDITVEDRTVTDGVTTSGSPNVTSATAVFATDDVGKTIVGTGIPVGATIITRTSATAIVISANASATGAAITLAIGNKNVKIRTIDSIVAITGGRAGNKYQVVSLPEDFNQVMCAMDKNPGLPTPKPVAIPCGYNGARWVKKGRQEPPSLEVSGKYTSFGDGLMRLNGFRCAAMLETFKDDRLLTERAIFWGWRPAITPKHGDGDSEDEVRAVGIYEGVAAFV